LACLVVLVLVKQFLLWNLSTTLRKATVRLNACTKLDSLYHMTQVVFPSLLELVREPVRGTISTMK
jgi:hypothetical protein